jgi:pyruvate,orthophosphate dikinase
MSLKDLLGGKGANLAEMTSVLGLPVPPGFTITTDACREHMKAGWPKGWSLDGEIADALAKVEKQMGKRLGDAEDPLLVSVRSGAKFSMPGMMDTVLNLGLNDRSVKGLAAQTGDDRFAYDSYRRFISMYGRIVLGIEAEPFDRLLDTAKEWDGVSDDAHVSAQTLERLCERYKGSSSARPARRSPRRPPTSSEAPSRPCSRRGTAPAPSPTASASASATTSAPR